MSLTQAQLLPPMTQALKGILSAVWATTGNYAELELAKIARTIQFIEKQAAAGKITAARARSHLKIQKTAAKAILTVEAGIKQLAAEKAINAALGAVKAIVNAAVGFALIP